MQRPKGEDFQTQEGEALRISILAFCCLIFTWEPRCIAGHRGLLSECLKAFLPTQMELDSRRAQATRSALIRAHGSLALRASKEQLLARLEGDIVGNILLLYSCSCRVRARSVPGCLSTQLQPLHVGGC